MSSRFRSSYNLREILRGTSQRNAWKLFVWNSKQMIEITSTIPVVRHNGSYLLGQRSLYCTSACRFNYPTSTKHKLTLTEKSSYFAAAFVYMGSFHGPIDLRRHCGDKKHDIPARPALTQNGFQNVNFRFVVFWFLWNAALDVVEPISGCDLICFTGIS